MLRTVQGKTALDLAYEAGRAKVLIDIMPTEMMVELLMRINDVVPRAVREELSAQQDKKVSPEVPGGPADARLRSPSHATGPKARTRQFSSVIRRTPDYMKKKRELRGRAMHGATQNRFSPADFETSQGLTSGQRAELFSDCYENGTGVYSHIQSNFATNLKTHDFLTILRSLTGLVVFEQLSVDGVVLLAPLHTSLLFLAVICGRFRIAEMLLRMRQFDQIPACVLVVLILNRLYREPTFPEQVRFQCSP
ncbi:unnamed protein product [Dibothriocephalus latus]|uniref:Uncharacterized protein n=1 Tax=Dibothriocephalus latus TaxID=60516 RepID=A0A3P7LDB6_DIBLA|nr:unnamed protein product [Dibothriocephalus latus]